MKKYLIVILSALSLTTFAQQTIALIETRVGDGSTAVSGMEKNMVRGELRKALVNFSGYDAITRADIDQMMQEQNFQRTGMVSSSQIKKLGEMSGADYICVATLTKSNTEFYLEAYLIHLESGKMSNPASQYGELVNGKLANMFPACQALANELLNGVSSFSSLQKSIKPAAYFEVDDYQYAEGRVSRPRLLSPYGRIVIRDEENPKQDINYNVVSFKVNVAGIEFMVEGDHFSEAVIERLSRCKVGNLCVITEIQAVNTKTQKISSFRGMTLSLN